MAENDDYDEDELVRVCGVLLQSPKFLQWQAEYLEGTGMEVYAERFAPAFHGLPFPVVAE